MTNQLRNPIEELTEKVEHAERGAGFHQRAGTMLNMLEDRFPEITSTAARLVDVCEICATNPDPEAPVHLARFDCDNCGKRTCNHCEYKSETLTASRFCSESCASEAENIVYLDQKAGC